MNKQMKLAEETTGFAARVLRFLPSLSRFPLLSIYILQHESKGPFSLLHFLLRTKRKIAFVGSD